MLACVMIMTVFDYKYVRPSMVTQRFHTCQSCEAAGEAHKSLVTGLIKRFPNGVAYTCTPDMITEPISN